MVLGNANERSNFNSLKTSILASIRKISIGRIIDVNSDGTFNIELMEYFEIIKEEKNKTVKYQYQNPVLESVPIAESNFISKYTRNDYVYIGFTDYYFRDNFYKKNAKYPQELTRVHSLGNAFIICKATNIVNKNIDENGEVVKHDKTIMIEDTTAIVFKNDKIKIKNSQTDIKTIMNGIVDDIIEGVKNAFTTAMYGTYALANASAVNSALDSVATTQKQNIDKLFY